MQLASLGVPQAPRQQSEKLWERLELKASSPSLCVLLVQSMFVHRAFRVQSRRCVDGFLLSAFSYCLVYMSVSSVAGCQARLLQHL